MVLWKSICYKFQHNCQKYYPQHRSNLLFWNLFHFVNFAILQNIYWKIYWNINKNFIARLLKADYDLVAIFRPWDQANLVSQLDWKSKTWCFTLLNVYVSWIERHKITISQLSPPKFRHFATRMNQRGNPIKINFDVLQIQKWISQTVRAQKINEKIGSFA